MALILAVLVLVPWLVRSGTLEAAADPAAGRGGRR